MHTINLVCFVCTITGSLKPVCSFRYIHHTDVTVLLIVSFTCWQCTSQNTVLKCPFSRCWCSWNLFYKYHVYFLTSQNTYQNSKMFCERPGTNSPSVMSLKYWGFWNAQFIFTYLFIAYVALICLRPWELQSHSMTTRIFLHAWLRYKGWQIYIVMNFCFFFPVVCCWEKRRQGWVVKECKMLEVGRLVSCFPESVPKYSLWLHTATQPSST